MSLPEEGSFGESHKFRVLAVVVHIGPQPKGGHYVAYRRFLLLDGSTETYKIDDMSPGRKPFLVANFARDPEVMQGWTILVLEVVRQASPFSHDDPHSPLTSELGVKAEAKPTLRLTLKQQPQPKPQPTLASKPEFDVQRRGRLQAQAQRSAEPHPRLHHQQHRCS